MKCGIVIAAVGLLAVGWPFASARSDTQLHMVRCLHDAQSEGSAEVARRQQALTLAREIHSAEARLAQRTRTYSGLKQLGALPPTPEGFELRFFTDGERYIFSIKDKRDICAYGVFSDQDGLLYEKTPKLPQMALAIPGA